MTDRIRRHPQAANVTIAQFVDLPIGVSIAPLTLEPGAELAISREDDEGEGLFVTHGTGWVTNEQGGREEVVAGNIVYYDFNRQMVIGTDVGMIVLRVQGGFMMPTPHP